MSRLQIEKVADMEGIFFPYKLVKFPNMNAYGIGVMDLHEENAREGGESNVIFYFLITPQEFAWYPDHTDKLNNLAQLLQIRMPKRRFLLASSKNKISPEEMKTVCDRALTSDALDDDQDFDNWVADFRQQNLENRKKLDDELKEKGFLENHNEMIHNLILRSMQIGQSLRKQGDNMEETQKKQLQELDKQLTFRTFFELGRTILFCPVQIPENQEQNFSNNIVYTADAYRKMQDLKKALNQKNLPLYGSDFTGKQVVIDSGDRILPICAITTPDQKNFLAVYTSRTAALKVPANTAPHIQLMALSFDDLVSQFDKIQQRSTENPEVRPLSGIAVDPYNLFRVFDRKIMDIILKIKAAAFRN